MNIFFCSQITSGPLVTQTFDLYFDVWRTSPPDVLLLGCTHYPLFKQSLSEYLPDTQIIDSASVCARYLGQRLLLANIPADPREQGSLQINVTDASSTVGNYVQIFLGEACQNQIKRVTL